MIFDHLIFHLSFCSTFWEISTNLHSTPPTEFILTIIFPRTIFSSLGVYVVLFFTAPDLSEDHYNCLSFLLYLTLSLFPEFLFFLKLINLFYFWLHWVFAARGLSLVAASGGYSSLRCAGFSLPWLLLLQGTGSRCAGFSSCGTRAVERRLNSCGARA